MWPSETNIYTSNLCSLFFFSPLSVAEAVKSVHQACPDRLRRGWATNRGSIGDTAPSCRATTELQLCPPNIQNICSFAHIHTNPRIKKTDMLTLSQEPTALHRHYSLCTLHSRVTHTNTHTPRYTQSLHIYCHMTKMGVADAEGRSVVVFLTRRWGSALISDWTETLKFALNINKRKHSVAFSTQVQISQGWRYEKVRPLRSLLYVANNSFPSEQQHLDVNLKWCLHGCHFSGEVGVGVGGGNVHQTALRPTNGAVFVFVLFFSSWTVRNWGPG